MIQIKNVSFSYSKTPILKDISLELEKGKLYAIIGPNGSGKTTLIKILSNLICPKSGELLLDNVNYKAIDRKAFAKKVALLPQGRNIPNMTVYDFVACGRFPHLSFTRKLSIDDESIISSVLKQTNTESFANKSLKNLSGGERQRVYIAMLLAQDAPYILLDEPTTHLDISSKFDIMNLLCKIREKNKCVIAVLHDIELALKYADSIILMSDSRVVSNVSPIETVSCGNIEKVFGVKCSSINFKEQIIYNFSE